MKIKDFLLEDCSINWEFALTIPEISILETIEQSPRWHSEGNVLIHTRLVCDEMHKQTNNIDRGKRELLMVSALFHDLGKATCTTITDDGVIHSYGHEQKSFWITNELLSDESYSKRSYVCNMVKNHMRPLIITASKRIKTKVFNLSKEVNIKDLLLLKHCDCTGSIMQEYDGWKDKLELIKNIAINLEIYDMKAKGDFDVYLLIGIPGSGKSTYSNSLNLPIISRDVIRIELGLVKEGEKGVGDYHQEKIVSEKFDEKMISLCQQKKSFIIDNTNLKKKYRDNFKEKIMKYNANVKFVYFDIDFELCCSRREGQISREIMQKMYDGMEIPTEIESDNIIIIK